MNSSSSAKTYMRMQSTLIADPESICMLVEVIAPYSRNISWQVTLDGEKQPVNKNIRRVSIDKFYEIVTGEKDAFLNLCKILPTVINDVVKNVGFKMKQNTVLEELKKLSPDMLTSLFVLAFDKYEGFADFKVKI